MAMQTQSTAVVVRPAEKMDNLKNMLDERMPNIRALIPKHLTAERLVKVALGAISRNPELLACSQSSIFFAVLQAAELGLEFGNTLGHAYMVPFKNKHTKKLEATFIPGYRGLIALARRSGQIVSIEAHPVFEKDLCEVRFGTDPKIEHVPFLRGDAGPLTMVYAVACLRDGGKQSEVMTLSQILAIRDKSPAGEAGPWSDHFDEMSRKTVVRRLWKYLPMSIEMIKAAGADDAANAAAGGDFSGIADMMRDAEAPQIEHGESPVTPIAGLKESLKKKAEEPRMREPGED